MPLSTFPTHTCRNVAAMLFLTLFATSTSTLPVARAASDDAATMAGTATAGYSGDGGPATSAQLSGALGVAVDTAGNVFIADQFNNRVRKVDPSNVITTVAGDGTIGFGGDGGPATAAQISEPLGVAVDAAGNLFISDTGNGRIRRVDAATAIITTIAGNGSSGYSGDGGLATAASLNRPRGLVVDAAGNVFIADANNNRVRRVDGGTGNITTVAGAGLGDFSGDGGAATMASINLPTFLALDAAENLLIADTFNGRVRRVDAASGVISTVVGNGTAVPAGDGGLATEAGGLVPLGVAVDGAGNLVFADSADNRIRLVHGASGVITTIAGVGSCGYTGDGGPALAAQICTPGAVAIDATGTVLFADNHSAIRSIVNVGPCGDGILAGGEQCDDAVANGTDVSCCDAGCSTVGDSDGDGPCDVIDVCTNVGGAQDFAAKPPAKLLAGKVNTDITPLNDKLSLSGEFVMSGGPAFSAIDPLTQGARIVVESGSGVRRIDARLPGGAYGGKGTRGWTLGGSGKKWAYKDATTAPIRGITKMAIADKSKTAAGRVQVKVSGGPATYPIVAGDVPLRGIVVAGDASAATAGYCGETAFGPGRCAFNASGTTVVCK